MSAATVDQQQQQDSQDSRAAFAAINGAEAPAPAPAITEKPVAEVPAVEPVVEAPPAATDSLIEGMTNEQIKSLLAKAATVDDLQKDIRALNGRYGELNQKLQERVTAPSAPAAPAAVELPAIDPEFESSYGEFATYAQAVSRKAVEDALKALPQNASASAIDTALVKAQDEMERKFLTYMHSDWQDVLKQDDYKLWLNTQPPEVQATATTTTEALELGKVLSSFKDWKTKAGDTTQRNRQRLQQGLAPTGTVGQSAHVPTDQDAARAAYNAIRGIK